MELISSLLNSSMAYDKGKRKYMEDRVTIKVDREDPNSITYFLAVYDGHGGSEAVDYTKKYLIDEIKRQPGFYDSNPDKVKRSIHNAFIKTHWDMYKVVEEWPKRNEHNSTSGTTATVVVIRDQKMYVAHVGDSAAIIASKVDGCLCSDQITVDHKPESEIEKSRIESMGGRVSLKVGIPRVMWRRPVKTPPLESLRSSDVKYEYVPFLAVARALGDFWSYNEDRNDFVVSPTPDVSCIDLKPGVHKFIVLASDGLWGVMSPKEAMDSVVHYNENIDNIVYKNGAAHFLVRESLHLWKKRKSRADNISVIVLYLDDEFGHSEPQFRDSDSCITTEPLSDVDDLTPSTLPFPRPLARSLVLAEPTAATNKRKLEDDCPPLNPGEKHLRLDLKTNVSPESLTRLQFDDSPTNVAEILTTS